MIKTERLTIKYPCLSDVNDFYEYARNPNVGPMAGWKPHTSIDESEKILKSIIDSKEVYGIYLADKLIGTVGIHARNKAHIKELGYVLAEEHWGKGFMPEVCEAVIKEAFEDEELIRLEVRHFDFNTQSRRVIEKLGFKFEGILRANNKIDDKVFGSYVYSIIRTDLGG